MIACGCGPGYRCSSEHARAMRSDLESNDGEDLAPAHYTRADVTLCGFVPGSSHCYLEIGHTGAHDTRPATWNVGTATLSRDVAGAILATVGEIVRSVRDGAYSARLGDTSTLTYADGWAAASNLAQLVAADAVAELISPPE